MKRTLALGVVWALFCVSGCAPKMHYVKRDLGVVDGSTEVETRKVNPLVASVETDGTSVRYKATWDVESRTIYYDDRMFREVYREKCGFCTGLVFGLSGTWFATLGVGIGEGVRRGEGEFQIDDNVPLLVGISTWWVGIPATIASGIRISEVAKHPPKEYTVTELDREGNWSVTHEAVPLTGDWEVVHEIPESGESYSFVGRFKDGLFTTDAATVNSNVWRNGDWQVRLVQQVPGDAEESSQIGAWVLLRVGGDTATAFEAALHKEAVDAVMFEREAARTRIAEEAARARRARQRKDPCHKMRRGDMLGRLFNGYQCLNESVGKAITVLAPEEVKLQLIEQEKRVQAEYRAELVGAFFGSGSSASASSARVERDSGSGTSSRLTAEEREIVPPPENFCVGEVRYPDGSTCRNCPVSGATGSGVTERVYTDGKGLFYLPMSNSRMEHIYVDGVQVWSGNERCRGGCRIDVVR